MSFLSNPKAINLVKSGEKRVTIIEKIRIIRKNLIKIAAAKLLLYFAWLKAGKKACVKAPSAKTLLKRFGNLKATKNISEYIFAPRIEAVRRSLKNPRTLEKSIPKLLVNIFLNIDKNIPKNNLSSFLVYFYINLGHI